MSYVSLCLTVTQPSMKVYYLLCQLVFFVCFVLSNDVGDDTSRFAFVDFCEEEGRVVFKSIEMKQ